jgi:DMSO/TMAO reductase YedYZ molybdopterin-dependent catalytic subunit
MNDEILLTVDGKVGRPLHLTFTDLAKFPEPDQVCDVSRFHPTRKGDGVTLDAILDRAGVLPAASYLTLHAERDDFHVSVPLEPLRGQGIVVYRLGTGRLALEHGGPIRFLIRDPAACHTDQLDDCANVKYLTRVELTEGRGRDTRPADDKSHEALHKAQNESSTAVI